MPILRWTLMLALMAGTAQAPASSAPPEPPHYDLRLEVDPERQHIRVTGTLTLAPTDSVRFFLHRQLRVESFGRAGGGAYSVDRGESGVRYLPDAMAVTVPTGAGVEPTAVAFEYEGTITEWSEWSASVIGPEWTELGLYLPWFPYAPEIGRFTYRLEVDAAPGYTVTAVGEPDRRGSTTVFRRARPTNDIVVVAAPDLRVRSSRVGGGTFRLAATDLSEATADSIVTDVSRILKSYGQWFGTVSGDMLLVASEREQGGGYTRPGGAFLAGLDDATYLDDRTKHTRYLGHELAHLWWYRADANSWEDWLNESIAEYSALLAVRELAGRDEYRRRLDAKREAAAEAPPIRDFDRDGDDARTVLYSKGPVLLTELESRIGRTALLALLRKAAETGVATTAVFLDILENQAGTETRRWFEGRLQEDSRL